ncbi:SigB/SigF/SigG family RNA polymerase sigma factor [Amycolatopsis sp. NPDC059021]|uniref:SigB/SigF/SigG family RNA polymerase sigma factor n=1 Tax=Amycolatopsis sp. NPDC059021 TaxID=3346704 RepID=UPI00366B9BF1
MAVRTRERPETTEGIPAPRRQRHRDTYGDSAALFEALHRPDATDAGRERLRRQLIEEHLPLAEHIARRFARRGEAHEDLVQVARLGLVNAVDRFEPGRGTDFLDFAVPTVMGEVRRYFRDSGWSVRVPRRLKELHLALNRATTTLAQRWGKAPTAKELADHLDLDVEEVTEALIAGNAYQATSIDRPVSTETEDLSLADTLGEDDPDLEGVENHEALRPLLRKLPQREQSILIMRFYGNMTQSQIAARVGLSQMHVSRLLSATLRTLREELTEAEGD